MRKAFENQLIGVFWGCLASYLLGNVLLPYLAIPWFWLLPILWVLSKLLAFIWKKCLQRFFLWVIAKFVQHTRVRPYAVRVRSFLDDALKS